MSKSYRVNYMETYRMKQQANWMSNRLASGPGSLVVPVTLFSDSILSLSPSPYCCLVLFAF